MSSNWKEWVKRTFLFEADLNGDKVLKEDIIDMRVIQIKELFQLCRLSIFWKIKDSQKRNELERWQDFDSIEQKIVIKTEGEEMRLFNFILNEESHLLYF